MRIKRIPSALPPRIYEFTGLLIMVGTTWPALLPSHVRGALLDRLPRDGLSLFCVVFVPLPCFAAMMRSASTLVAGTRDLQHEW